MGSILWRILRYLYAAYYLYVGIFLALSLIGLVSMPPLKISAQSAAFFQEALSKAGFMDPALAVTYIIAAAALCLERTTPLGLVLLAPVAVIIFFTDTLLDTAWITGTTNAAILVLLAWHFRSAYRPLWSYSIANKETKV